MCLGFAHGVVDLVSGLFAFYPNEHRHPSGLITHSQGFITSACSTLDPCSQSSMGWELGLISAVVMLLLLARGNISLNPDTSQPCLHDRPPDSAKREKPIAMASVAAHLDPTWERGSCFNKKRASSCLSASHVE